MAERIAFLLADLADLPGGGYDLIVANPPYILADEVPGLMPEVRDFEPHLALNGGADGLAAAAGWPARRRRSCILAAGC